MTVYFAPLFKAANRMVKIVNQVDKFINSEFAEEQLPLIKIENRTFPACWVCDGSGKVFVRKFVYKNLIDKANVIYYQDTTERCDQCNGDGQCQAVKG